MAGVLHINIRMYKAHSLEFTLLADVCMWLVWLDFLPLILGTLLLKMLRVYGIQPSNF